MQRTVQLPEVKAREVSEHESKIKRLAEMPLAKVKQELDAAFAKLKTEKNPDGSYVKENNAIKVTVENAEDQINAVYFQGIQAVYVHRKRLEKTGKENFIKNSAVLGSINYMWTNGIGAQNAAAGAFLGSVHGALLYSATSRLGFWGKTCAALGAVATPFKVGLGFDLNMLAGAEVGMLIGTIIDGLGDWGKTGLKIGLLGGLCTYGLALEAVLLAGGCLAAAGSLVDTAVVASEACRKPRP